MGRDKAALSYHGASQLDWAMALVKPFVERVFASVRTDQTGDPVRSKHDQIIDTHENLGPIAGILAAQARYPDAAWLVLACDLPFLEKETLEHLIRARRTDRLATAYRSSRDGLPEPLCAIYEPASREPLAAYVGSGKQCPRKFLIQSQIELLEEPNPRALDNINTPSEHGAALSELEPSGPGPEQHIQVQYFALLREQAKRREESVTTRARTPGDLYAELRKRHGFTLPATALRVAVNTDFADWSRPLREGDVVVFIPPVAGG
jgi:molybdopterin-guanine dinucleotide biosynthesis protein A